MHAFRQFITQYVYLSNEDWGRIEQNLTQLTLQKGQLLLKQGQVCRHLYFIEQGLLRFFVEDTRKEFTKFFTVAPFAFTSQKSFNLRQPSAENIQALEKSIIWQMGVDDANALLELTAWNTFIRKLIQQVQDYTENILQEMQSKTAEQRYRQMLTNNSPLLQRVPLKYIASYLGVEPQSLSRIRKSSLKS